MQPSSGGAAWLGPARPRPPTPGSQTKAGGNQAGPERPAPHPGAAPPFPALGDRSPGAGEGGRGRFPKQVPRCG